MCADLVEGKIVSKTYSDAVAEGRALEKERIAQLLEREHFNRTEGCPYGMGDCPSCFFAASFMENFLLIHFDSEHRKKPKYGDKDSGYRRLDNG